MKFKPNTVLMGDGMYHLVRLGGIDYPSYIRYERNEDMRIFGMLVVHVPAMKSDEYKMAFMIENIEK